MLSCPVHGIVNEENILYQVVSKKALVYSEGCIIVHQLVSYKLCGELQCLACTTFLSHGMGSLQVNIHQPILEIIKKLCNTFGMSSSSFP